MGNGSKPLVILNRGKNYVIVDDGENWSALAAGLSDDQKASLIRDALLVQETAGKASLSPGFPRFWSLLAYLFPPDVRESCYDKSHEHLVKDYATARRYRTKWARLWLTFAFSVRTLVLVADCSHEWLKDRVGKWFPWIRALFRLFQ